MPGERQTDLFDLLRPSESEVEAAALPSPSTPARHPEAMKPEVIFKRSLRADHYRLTLRRDGVPLVTIPA
ncbi:MAG TPA: hypothetical protein PLV87_16690, partial [Opitutaceae bacterium]|nr:hypothetical protein [Opitutaceae bacterium]